MHRQLLPLQLTRFVFTLALAAACSDAKPRPQVPEEIVDAGSDAADASIVDAGADATCSLPASFGSSSCNACVGGQCCDLLAACEADAQCAARTRCWLGCFSEPDAGGCQSACEAQHSDENDLWYELWGCVYFRPPCETQCANTR